MKLLTTASAILFLLSVGLLSQEKPIVWSDQEKPIVEQLHNIRNLP